MDRVFISSPARTSGKRAAMVMNPAAQFELAERLRKDPGAPIGEGFSFLSGLYFRGKLAYARHFGRTSEPLESCYVITSEAGLVSATLPVGVIERKRALADRSRVYLLGGHKRLAASTTSRQRDDRAP